MTPDDPTPRPEGAPDDWREVLRRAERRARIRPTPRTPGAPVAGAIRPADAAADVLPPTSPAEQRAAREAAPRDALAFFPFDLFGNVGSVPPELMPMGVELGRPALAQWYAEHHAPTNADGAAGAVLVVTPGVPPGALATGLRELAAALDRGYYPGTHVGDVWAWARAYTSDTPESVARPGALPPPPAGGA